MDHQLIFILIQCRFLWYKNPNYILIQNYGPVKNAYLLCKKSPVSGALSRWYEKNGYWLFFKKIRCQIELAKLVRKESIMPVLI